jgi:methylmalonyl-CoA mutase
LCSSDALYAETAADVARALKAAGAERVYLAGRPGDHRAEWEAAGVDEFVYQGCDRLDVLTRALDTAGVT